MGVMAAGSWNPSRYVPGAPSCLTITALSALYNEGGRGLGGIRRFYRGVGPALFQAARGYSDRSQLTRAPPVTSIGSVGSVTASAPHG